MTLLSCAHIETPAQISLKRLMPHVIWSSTMLHGGWKGCEDDPITCYKIGWLCSTLAWSTSLPRSASFVSSSYLTPFASSGIVHSERIGVGCNINKTLGNGSANFRPRGHDFAAYPIWLCPSRSIVFMNVHGICKSTFRWL